MGFWHIWVDWIVIYSHFSTSAVSYFVRRGHREEIRQEIENDVTVVCLSLIFSTIRSSRWPQTSKLCFASGCGTVGINQERTACGEMFISTPRIYFPSQVHRQRLYLLPFNQVPNTGGHTENSWENKLRQRQAESSPHTLDWRHFFFSYE